MLSSVSNLADKDFVIGFFVPALIAIMAAAFAFNGIPLVASWYQSVISDKSLTDLTYLAVTVWTVALILMVCNHRFYRILEGYEPPFSWFPGMKERHRRKMLELKRKHDDFIKIGNRAEASKITWTLNIDYPRDDTKLLPTRFGNRIRAFELYSNDLYGADGVTMWPRLAAVVPAQFAALVNDARAQVDFMMNSCFLAASIALLAIIRLVYEFACYGGFGVPDLYVLAGTIAIGLAVTYASYLGATEGVVGWGDTVKSAFDCFLPDLAKQLGYDSQPTALGNKLFWDDVTRLLLYHRPFEKQWRRLPRK